VYSCIGFHTYGVFGKGDIKRLHIKGMSFCYTLLYSIKNKHMSTKILRKGRLGVVSVKALK